MTKEQIIKFRDEIGKETPMKVICDNEHFFYDNLDEYFPIIWDDDNEVLIQIQPNNHDQYSAPRLPYRISISMYEHIQFIEAYVDMKMAVKSIDNLKSLGFEITDEQKEKYMELFRSGGSSRTVVPGTRLPSYNPTTKY